MERNEEYCVYVNGKCVLRCRDNGSVVINWCYRGCWL